MISSGLGGAAPVRVTAWPVISRDVVLGILEVASFRSFSPREASLLEGAPAGRGVEPRDPLRGASGPASSWRGRRNRRGRRGANGRSPTQSQEELLAQQGELTAQREQSKVSEERSRLILESSGEGIFGRTSRDESLREPRRLPDARVHRRGTDRGRPSHRRLSPPPARRQCVTPRRICPMYAAYKHVGKASRIDDELLWRKDGTGVPVEYGATPMAQATARSSAPSSALPTSPSGERNRAEGWRPANVMPQDPLETCRRRVTGTCPWRSGCTTQSPSEALRCDRAHPQARAPHEELEWTPYFDFTDDENTANPSWKTSARRAHGNRSGVRLDLA